MSPDLCQDATDMLRFRSACRVCLEGSDCGESSGVFAVKSRGGVSAGTKNTASAWVNTRGVQVR